MTLGTELHTLPRHKAPGADDEAYLLSKSLGGWGLAKYNLLQAKLGSGHQFSAAAIGDSITSYNLRRVSLSSVTWADGVATWTNTGIMLFLQGGSIYVSGGASGAFNWNGPLTIRSILSSTQFTTNVPSRVTAASGSINIAGVDNAADMAGLADAGYLTWANAFLRGRMNIVAIAGLGGDRLLGTTYLVQPWTRVDTEIAPYTPDVCFVMLGTNDINDTSGSARTIPQIYEALLEVVNRLNYHNICPIVLTLPPFGSGIATGVRDRHHWYNELIRNGAGNKNGYICIDVANGMTATSGGTAIAGFMQADRIHPSRIGARSMGRAIADYFGAASSSNLLVMSDVDNIVTNASNLQLLEKNIWTASGGSVSGTGLSGVLPTNWIGARLDAGAGGSTCVFSAEARSQLYDGDELGYNIRMDMKANGGDLFNPWVRNSETLTTKFVAGGVYELRCPLRVEGVLGSNLNEILVWVQMTLVDTLSGFSYNYNLNAMLTGSSEFPHDFTSPAGNLIDGDMNLMLRSLPITMPAAFASGNGFNVRALFAGTGNPCSMLFGRPTLMRIR